jgi:quercetin dioxygenase-like cupin family protein
MPKLYAPSRSSDVAPMSFLNDVQKFEAKFYTKPLELEQGGLSVMKLAPGVVSFPHRHKEQEEIVLVLSGECEVKVDDEILKLGELDAIRIAPQAARAYRGAGSGPAVIAVFGAPHTDTPDFEKVEDFWTD